MLLTFIFNYIPLAEAFATLPHFLPSIFNLTFLLYQVDGYLCCSLNTNTRAKEFLMTREKKHKEILFWRSTRNPLEKRRRERERWESRSSSFLFFHRKYGRKSWVCVGCWLRCFPCKHFLMKSLTPPERKIFPFAASENFAMLSDFLRETFFQKFFLWFSCARHKLIKVCRCWEKNIRRRCNNSITSTDIFLRSPTLIWDVFFLSVVACTSHTLPQPAQEVIQKEKKTFCREMKKSFCVREWGVKTFSFDGFLLSCGRIRRVE